MMRQAVVAGGGIGGLAATVALSRAGWEVQVLEKSAAFNEVGAGVQLGPNAVKVLEQWGLKSALADISAEPSQLQVRCALTGHTLGKLTLGAQMRKRYGAPYVTVHRADLHSLLLKAVQQQADTQLKLSSPLQSFKQNEQGIALTTASRATDFEVDALVGADGLWSSVRQQLLDDGQPLPTGQLAYRALIPQANLPPALRSQQVTAWLGPRLHVVHYPVRGGDALNVVVIVHGPAQTPLRPPTSTSANPWDYAAHAADLSSALAGTCSPLQAQVAAMPQWRLWPLYDRPPMRGAYQQALGRVALLGDAAHPMRPFLAQGAGMAIEDAAELGHALGHAIDPAFDVATMLQRYALNRWQRNARVQARSRRNGEIFHAQGLLRWGRNTSLRLLGEKILDVPWLYGAQPKSS